MADDMALGYALGQDNNNGSGFFGGEGLWAVIILAIIFGWGNYGGYGGFGGQNGSLSTDTAMIERKIDGVNNGLCDGFYAQNTNLLNGFSGVQNTLAQGFAGLNTALVQQGYETRNGITGIGTQLASCCCDIKGVVKDGTTQGIINTNAIQNQLASGFCDIGYKMQDNHNATVIAIDKVGDRVIDYLANKEAQNLRDENQALRLAASQSAQNQYLINQLRPMPIPAYQSCNPWASVYGCQCGNTCV